MIYDNSLIGLCLSPSHCLPGVRHITITQKYVEKREGGKKLTRFDSKLLSFKQGVLA